MKDRTMPVEKSRPISAGKLTFSQSFDVGRGYVLALAALVICFAAPLYRLVRFAISDDLYSYILLMPFVSGYLIYTKPQRVIADSPPLRGVGLGLLIAGVAVAGGYYLTIGSDSEVAIEDYLAANMLSFFICLLGVSCLFLGREKLRALAFPLGMLVFVIPMPEQMRASLQLFLQYGSAYVAHAMFWLAGTPFLRTDLVFNLSVINIKVAPECSGIHSSWILLITSLLAGYLFLRSPWRRTALTVAVLPLALLRNGFRVFTIGELCVHISPKMIDSPIHHQGGPLFFVLSLIPFFMFLVWLHRKERGPKPAAQK